MREDISGMQTSSAHRTAMRRRASNYRHCSREPSSPINTQGERERYRETERQGRADIYLRTSPDIWWISRHLLGISWHLLGISSVSHPALQQGIAIMINGKA
jgi:hypothetical protein